MTVRKNQANLTAAEKKAFVDAVLEVKRIGVYDEFVAAHRLRFALDMNTGVYVGHFGPSFLPWHRKFLIDFENELQKIDASVSIPYWDWTADNTVASSVWAPDLLGGTGRPLDDQVMDGPFAYSAGKWPINIQVDSRPFLARNLAYRVPTLPSRAEVDAALAIPTYDSAPFRDGSAGFRATLEGSAGYLSMHNRVHSWVWGQMESSVSPNDPVFWLHHSFVDKLWADWHALHPTSAEYLPAGGTVDVIDLNETMPPWPNTTPQSMLDHTPFYTYA
ncbi:tyrosinase family protein [Streptomyces uncialis]|uniref:Tyrosinase n=1 Tax=Streptomyces uncialis TaxID=1048205 RepID=A0A1Q4V843_9ACTN|nr:tyrosinase family protein [Streptomyces uncialis]MCX4661823.1 tyrosinase family protein [Streptomyces uncialis]OKH94013.1 tyrosinase [Streptomyces uncialis]WTE09096.1 tyrosinase family protein [Streptomyces uncialis]